MGIKYLYNKGASFCFAITFLIVLLGSAEAKAQGGTTVSGTVIDDTGMTMPGVNIVETGTSNSTVTDLDGKFSINVAGPESQLSFTYIGFETLTKTVGSATELSVVLKTEASELDEVVVVGYGTAKKSDLTGAVVSISGQKLAEQARPSIAETLTGRLPGVQVNSTEGSPDAEINIRVRGGSSLSQDASPLVIVDGFPVNSINDISPNDIDQLTILKDASSTAIYGSRGANGVIIITTKSGSKDNKLSVSFNAFLGTKKIVKTIDVLDPQDYANWQYEYALLSDDLPSYEDVFGPWANNNSALAGVKGTNWQKEIYGRTGKVRSYDLGLRGGSEKLNYSFTYTRYDEDAIMVGSAYKRDNLSFSLKSKPSKKIGINLTMRHSDTKIYGGGANEQNEISSSDSRLRHSVGYAPIPLPGITTDNTDESVSSYLVNPYVSVEDNQRLQARKNFNMLSGITWDIIKNLQFKTELGLDYYLYNDKRFYGRTTYYVRNIPPVDLQGQPSLVINDRDDRRFRNANTLNYNFDELLSKDHSLNLLAGEEWINYQRINSTTPIQGFPDFFNFGNAVNINSQGTPQFVDNYVYPDDKLLSFFGRVNYSYKDRYLFTGTYRADGSSKFLGDNRWGYFPSAAVAWKLSSEDFLSDITWLNLLKIRASYGQAGNNNIPVGQTIQTFESNGSAWINGVSNYWSPAKILANPDLKWETTVTRNLGIDFDVFKGRLTGTFDTYKNTTRDLLIRFPVPGSGYDYQYRNMGEIENKGIEFSFNAVLLQEKDYGLSVAFNINYNKNNINSLGTLEDFNYSSNWASSAITGDYKVAQGMALGTMYGYKNDGRYEVSDFDYADGVYTLKPGVADAGDIVGDVTPGSMKLKDINGDGVIDLDDQTVIGHANPLHTGGFVINANAYGFDLMAAFNWSYGNNIYNANKIEFNTSTYANGQYRNLTTEMAAGNRWTNVDASTGQLVTDPTQLAALNANTTLWSPYMERYVLTDWAIEDGSFLRLNTLSLGYTVPKSVNDFLHITRLRFYATCNNVFVLTNYSGPDPEVSTRRDTPYTPGMDYSAYPRSRQYAFGLNLNF